MATTAARPAARKPTPPGIDGEVHLRDAGHLAPGDIVRVLVEEADDHDLFGVPLA